MFARVVLLILLIISVGCSTTKKKQNENNSPTDNMKNMADMNLNLVINGDSDSKNAGSLKTVYFDYRSSQISNEAQNILSANAAFLAEHPNLQIEIEGHGDERGSAQFNLALGEKRSISVEEFLAKKGITKDKIKVISVGKEKPVVFGHNEDAWKLNRRANFIIIGL
jgi:peptidoglycan-associated lipoprotein